MGSYTSKLPACVYMVKRQENLYAKKEASREVTRIVLDGVT